MRHRHAGSVLLLKIYMFIFSAHRHRAHTLQPTPGTPTRKKATTSCGQAPGSVLEGASTTASTKRRDAQPREATTKKPHAKIGEHIWHCAHVPTEWGTAAAAAGRCRVDALADLLPLFTTTHNSL
mmetsp:Transcript_3048/g.7618  ORF Transcript_3048/g.7618 Transcript_3048/m.7618 type:complete len:125 (+) Transcript_3048:472-846(+)